MSDRGSSWEVRTHRGSAADLHHLDLSSARAVHVMDFEGSAVALGSTQSEAMLDGAAVRAGRRAVTRRHSGGGLVVLDPGGMIWLDVVVPSADPLWRTDVGDAFLWLGRLWADALESVAGDVAEVHRGGPLFADLGRVVCFAGIGSGEVVVDGRKVVGMSQRRTRHWARFQCLVHGGFDADASLGVLAPHLVEGAFGHRLGDRLRHGVGTVPDLVGLRGAFIERLHLI